VGLTPSEVNALPFDCVEAFMIWMEEVNEKSKSKNKKFNRF